MCSSDLMLGGGTGPATGTFATTCTPDRRVDAATMADAQYAKVLEASNARYRLGAGSLLQLEDVRRTALQASQSLAAVKLERAQAWVALYKAVGGGWRDDTPNPHPDNKTTAPTAQGRTHTGSAS